MGGALAVHTALKAAELLEENTDDDVLTVKGICVIDVVEGKISSDQGKPSGEIDANPRG